MSASTVGIATNSFSAGVKPSVVLPAGIQADDLILCYVGQNNYMAWTAPTGYPLYHEGASSSSGLTSALHYKVAAGTESGNTVSWTGGSGTPNGSVGALVLRGLDPVTPILGFSANNDGFSSVSGVAASVSWAGSYDVVSFLAFTWQGGSATVTLPSGWNSSPDGFYKYDGALEYTQGAANLTTVPGTTTIPARTVTWVSAPYGSINQYALKVASGPIVTSGSGSVGQFETSLRSEGWF